jgi:hypothetical protein
MVGYRTQGTIESHVRFFGGSKSTEIVTGELFRRRELSMTIWEAFMAWLIVNELVLLWSLQ